MEKAIFIFAGGNGSGKTSLYRRYRNIFKNLPYINADEMLKEVLGNNDPSNAKFGQDLANKKIEECLEKGESFVFETVFSHESKIELIKRAKLLGYTVSFYFCHLSSPQLNILRVKKRVEEGGHSVPEDRIVTRIPRTLKNVHVALRFADDFYLFDNSYSNGFQLVVYKRPRSSIVIDSAAPDWAIKMSRIESAKSLRKRRIRKNSLSRRKLYKNCIRCRRPLRGGVRRNFGVCSRCESVIR